MHNDIPPVDNIISNVVDTGKEILSEATNRATDITSNLKKDTVDKVFNKSEEITKNPIGKWVLKKLKSISDSFYNEPESKVADEPNINYLDKLMADNFSFFPQQQQYNSNNPIIVNGSNNNGNMLLPFLLMGLPQLQQSMANGNNAPVEEEAYEDEEPFDAGKAVSNMAKLFTTEPFAVSAVRSALGKGAMKNPLAATMYSVGDNLYDVAKDPTVAGTKEYIGANAFDNSVKYLNSKMPNNAFFRDYVNPVAAGVGNSMANWGVKGFYEPSKKALANARQKFGSAINNFRQGNWGKGLLDTVLGGANAGWDLISLGGSAIQHSAPLSLINQGINTGINTIRTSNYNKGAALRDMSLNNMKQQAQRMINSSDPAVRTQGLQMMENYNRQAYMATQRDNHYYKTNTEEMDEATRNKIQQDADYYALHNRYGNKLVNKDNWNKYQQYLSNTGDKNTDYWSYTGLKPVDKSIPQAISNQNMNANASSNGVTKQDVKNPAMNNPAMNNPAV